MRHGLEPSIVMQVTLASRHLTNEVWLSTLAGAACVRMLAIQNTCGAACCRPGRLGDAAFAFALANHNFASDNGPGPWVIAILDQFDEANTTNFGAGFHDVFPCPLQPSTRDVANRNNLLALPQNWQLASRWLSPGFKCDPSTCTSAPFYPNNSYGCYRCDEVARVGYVVTSYTSDPNLHLQLEVTDTKQRWETDAFAACFYSTQQCSIESCHQPCAFLIASF